MPINHKQASELSQIVHHIIYSHHRLFGRQIQMGRVEEGGIHDVQRQFKQALCSKWSERLGRAGTIANGLVVARGTVVGKARLIEFAG